MIKKILILRFSSFGDILMVNPLLRCLRRAHPTAQIDMVVREDFLDLIADNPHLNRKLGFPRKGGRDKLRALRDEINREHYDVIYDGHASLRTRLLMPQLNAGKKLYFKKHYVKRWLQLALKLPTLKRAKRTAEVHLENCAEIGVKDDGLGPEFFLPPALREAIATHFSVDRNDPPMGIAPSAQWEGKRWPLENFSEVLSALQKHPTKKVVIFGGPGDSFCEALLKHHSPENIIYTQGKLSLRESAALLSFCSFLICNDTGMMHMADALKIPSIAIFGPTSGALGCAPFSPRAHVLEHSLWCRPCSKNGQGRCIRGRRVCLERTTPAMVLEKAALILREASS